MSLHTKVSAVQKHRYLWIWAFYVLDWVFRHLLQRFFANKRYCCVEDGQALELLRRGSAVLAEGRLTGCADPPQSSSTCCCPAVKRPGHELPLDWMSANSCVPFLFLVREQLKELTKQYEKSENDLKALQSVGQVRKRNEVIASCGGGWQWTCLEVAFKSIFGIKKD